MTTKNLSTLTNVKLIRNRIFALPAPASPLKGRGNVRVECKLPLVFDRLQKIAPAHCETVSSREAINSFGKLGFVGHQFISPELNAIIEANSEDFAALEKGLSITARFGI